MYVYIYMYIQDVYMHIYICVCYMFVYICLYYIHLHIYIYNLGQNIWRLFYFLAQFFFTTSEAELDYYHQKVSVRAASRVAERLKT